MGEGSTGQEFNVEQLCVAEAIEDIDRTPAAVRYVLGSRKDQLDASVEEIVDQLCQSGDAELVSGTASARLTPAGRHRLELSRNWTFEVVDTFTVLRVSEYPLLRGRLRCGVVRPGDWCRNAVGSIGIVQDVEYAYSSTFAADESPVLCVGAEGFEAGDELTRFEPFGGAG